MPFDAASAPPPDTVYLRPGTHDVEIYDASETAGMPKRLIYRVRDDSGAVAKLEVDIEGVFAWRAAALCRAIGIRGWQRPSELVGRRVVVDCEPSPTNSQYLRVRAFEPSRRRNVVVQRDDDTIDT